MLQKDVLKKLKTFYTVTFKSAIDEVKADLFTRVYAFSPEQAEQLAWKAHKQGRSSIPIDEVKHLKVDRIFITPYMECNGKILYNIIKNKSNNKLYKVVGAYDSPAIRQSKYNDNNTFCAFDLKDLETDITYKCQDSWRIREYYAWPTMEDLLNYVNQFPVQYPGIYQLEFEF